MQKPDTAKFKQNLKRQVEENPVLSIGVFAAAATAVAKLMDANTERHRAKTHDREVRRREAQTFYGKRR